MEKHVIYLVVPDSERNSNLRGINYATFDQYKAQQMCHRIAKISGKAQGLIKEEWFNLSVWTRVKLRETFKLNLKFY